MLRQKGGTEGGDGGEGIGSDGSVSGGGDGGAGGRGTRRPNLDNEVGAWTSAIKACGRAGRLDTAVTLFHTMQKFGAKPNTVTCGCLTDCLLKSKDYEVRYVDETVRVMRYMKDEGLEPSEVMYTSLMSAATRLAKVENKRRGKLVLLDFGDGGGDVGDLAGDGNDDGGETIVGGEGLDYRSSRGKEGDVADAIVGESEEAEPTKALEIYTELILSLVSPTTVAPTTTAAFDGFGSSATNDGRSSNPNTTEQQQATTTATTNAPAEEANALLVKVFLVFQEMKASGSDPDLACYNALLQACARAGDTARLMDVMQRIQGDGFHPNNKSWREMLRGAAKARRSDVAEEIWEMALGYGAGGGRRRGAGAGLSEGGSGGRDRYSQRGEGRWVPNADAFEALIGAYIRHASVVKREASTALLVRVIQAFMEVVEGDDVRGLHHVDVDLVKKNLRVMSMLSKAATSVEKSIGILHDTGRGSSSSSSSSTESDCFPFSQQELRAIMAEFSVDNRSPTR